MAYAAPRSTDHQSTPWSSTHALFINALPDHQRTPWKSTHTLIIKLFVMKLCPKFAYLFITIHHWFVHGWIGGLQCLDFDDFEIDCRSGVLRWSHFFSSAMMCSGDEVDRLWLQRRRAITCLSPVMFSAKWSRCVDVSSKSHYLRIRRWCMMLMRWKSRCRRAIACVFDDDVWCYWDGRVDMLTLVFSKSNYLRIRRCCFRHKIYFSFQLDSVEAMSLVLISLPTMAVLPVVFVVEL